MASITQNIVWPRVLYQAQLGTSHMEMVPALVSKSLNSRPSTSQYRTTRLLITAFRIPTGGNVYTDTIKFNNVNIKGQAVEVATHLDATFAGEHGSDGLLGLAFPQ